uniref:General transcription factor 3C polypeptide 1-like n=1 Tax=Salmo trutta TaxID=8032 RepID=A0A673ZX95_SALTR
MDPLDIVMDEVALEGLDGVTILSLWIRLEKRNPAFPRNLDPYTKEFIWKSLVSNHEVDFYELPQERADVVLVDRFADIDPDTGIQEASCWDRVDSYPVQILLEDKRGIQGSCVFFKERRNVTPIIRTTDLTPRLTLEDAFKRWGRKLVMVASQRVRFRVLIGDGGDPDMKLTDHSYCILERLGRARWQGELQRDLHSCSFKTDPRKMHYLRKSLTQNDLITMQSHVIRLASGAQQHSILLLLKRFHVDRRSKYDILMELTSNLLSEAPNHIASMITLRDQLSISERTFKRMYQYMQAAKLVQVVIKPVEHLNPTVGTCDTRRGMYPTHYLTTSTLQTVRSCILCEGLTVRSCILCEGLYVHVFFEGLYVHVYLYVKRNCMIVDTTMCEPHYNLVLETRVFERRRYTLNTLTDVDNYWFDLMCVCLNTPLGVIRKERPKRSSASKSQEGPVKVPVDTDRHKFRHLDHMGSREVCYAAVIPGDSKGAGGLDSDFFGHLKRNWIWTCHLMRTKRVKHTHTLKHNCPKFPGPLSSKQGVPAGLRLEEVHISTEPSSRNLLVKGGNKRKRKRTVKQVKIPQKKKKEVRKRAPVHDAADHKALMMMTRQRVTWSVSEDSVLILCRVASHFLNRKLRRPFVPWCVVRDLLHAEFEESLDKTSPSVGRRSRYILKNPQTHLNYKICLAEVYQDKPLIGKLQGRKHNPNDPEECSTVFREFVSLLRQKFSSASGSCDVTIPDTKTQLFSRIEDIHSLVLNNLIQSTLAMSNSQMKCCRSFQTFHTYSRYRQEVLCQVFVQCRKKGLVNRRRISQLCGPNKNRALPILPMSYQLSQSYYRCFTWRLPTGLCTEVFDFMQALSRNGTGDNHPSTMLQFPLESPGGATLACLSLMTLGLLSVHVSIPEHIVVLDSTMVDNEVVKSISVLAEDDDDDEEESEGRRGIEVRAHKASHTKYLMMRGYCVPGIVNLRNLNTNDSIVVESCTMRLHLRHTPVHTLFITQGRYTHLYTHCLLPSVGTHTCTHSDLLEEELVLEVGGNSVRLVLLSHAEPWLLTSTERQRDRPHQAQQGASAFGDRKHHNPLLRKRRMVAPREQEPRSKRGRRETLMEEEEVEKRGETSEEEEERKKMQPEEKDRNETAEERWMKRAEEEEEMEKEERVQEEPSSTIETGQSTGETTADPQEGSVGVCDVSFISRPWRIVDGSLNRPVCKGMLEAVLYHIMTRPGLPEHILLEHYRGVLQPVVVLDLVQALVELGCIKKKYVTRRPKPSLFSRPAAFLMEEDRAGETGVRLGETGVRPAETTTVFYEPTIDCCLRLGQVLPHENNWNQWVQFAQHENKQ